MPSSLGLLHMSPYFLSKQELYTTWVIFLLFLPLSFLILSQGRAKALYSISCKAIWHSLGLHAQLNCPISPGPSSQCSMHNRSAYKLCILPKKQGVWALSFLVFPSIECQIGHMPPLTDDKFLCVQEAVKKIKLKSFLDNRVKKRRRSAEFVQKEMGKWAADRTGTFALNPYSVLLFLWAYALPLSYPIPSSIIQPIWHPKYMRWWPTAFICHW